MQQGLSGDFIVMVNLGVIHILCLINLEASQSRDRCAFTMRTNTFIYIANVFCNLDIRLS